MMMRGRQVRQTILSFCISGAARLHACSADELEILHTAPRSNRHITLPMAESIITPTLPDKVSEVGHSNSSYHLTQSRGCCSGVCLYPQEAWLTSALPGINVHELDAAEAKFRAMQGFSVRAETGWPHFRVDCCTGSFGPWLPC